MPSVDVVVVSWNGREDTLRALEAVEAQATPPSLERTVTVVDNGSTDGTAEAVARRHPGVRILRHAGNRGFTGGVRTGVEASRAELVVLLNNDAIPEPGWLAALTASMEEAGPDVVAVGGKIVDPTGRRADFVRGAMTFDGHGFQPGFRKLLEAVDEPPQGAEIFFACGGNMIVRRTAFLELGGFDDDYFAYLEDVDFGWRAWSAGRRILWEPRALARHRSSATSDRLGSFERGVLFERNALQTVLKNYDDAMLRRMAGPVFLTLLHRHHRYLIDRNASTAPLVDPPLDEGFRAPGRPSLLDRALRRAGLARIGRTPVVEDGLTRMQTRAVEWVFRHEARIFEKRERVQALRTRSDEEILKRFPLLAVPTYHGDEQLMAGPLFRALTAGLSLERSTLDDLMER